MNVKYGQAFWAHRGLDISQGHTARRDQEQLKGGYVWAGQGLEDPGSQGSSVHGVGWRLLGHAGSEVVFHPRGSCIALVGECWWQGGPGRVLGSGLQGALQLHKSKKKIAFN